MNLIGRSFSSCQYCEFTDTAIQTIVSHGIGGFSHCAFYKNWFSREMSLNLVMRCMECVSESWQFRLIHHFRSIDTNVHFVFMLSTHSISTSNSDRGGTLNIKLAFKLMQIICGWIRTSTVSSLIATHHFIVFITFDYINSMKSGCAGFRRAKFREMVNQSDEPNRHTKFWKKRTIFRSMVTPKIMSKGEPIFENLHSRKRKPKRRCSNKRSVALREPSPHILDRTAIFFIHICKDSESLRIEVSTRLISRK